MTMVHSCLCLHDLPTPKKSTAGTADVLGAGVGRNKGLSSSREMFVRPFFKEEGRNDTELDCVVVFSWSPSDVMDGGSEVGDVCRPSF